MCTSASQLCRRRRKHIILLSPADCMKPLLLIFVPSSCSWYPEIERWLPVPCCPAAWEWSAGVRTAGHYSVFRCAASYQCAGLTEAAALVNMPSARASSGGGGRGQDLTGTLDKLLQNKKISTQTHKYCQTASVALLKVHMCNPTTSSPSLHPTSSPISPSPRGADVRVEDVEEVFDRWRLQKIGRQSLVTSNREKMTI